MSKHTPGPWHHTTMLHGVQGIYGPDRYMVADAGNTRRSVAEQVANARLIAAAPELLEALQECITEDGAVAFASEDFYKAKQRLMAINNIARAAIAKATT